MKIEFESLLELEDFIIQLGWVKATQPQFTVGAPVVREAPSPALVALFSDHGREEPEPTPGIATGDNSVGQANSPHVDWRGPIAIEMGDFSKLKTVRQVVAKIKAEVADVEATTVVETCRVLVDKQKCPVLELLPAEDLEARVLAVCESLGIA